MPLSADNVEKVRFTIRVRAAWRSDRLTWRLAAQPVYAVSSDLQ